MASVIFNCSPTLQYQTTLKIIVTLLRNPEYEEMLKNVAWDTRYITTEEYRNEERLDDMVHHLEMKANAFPLPKSRKMILNRSISFVALNTTHWLVVVGEMTPIRLQEEYWSKTIYELIKHLQWDNIGCVDGPKTLESYVSNREAIDFSIWNLLCFHCMENEIRQFSMTIDWSKCEQLFSSALSVYWYKKIYGEFPTKNMYQHKLEKKILSMGKFSEEKILECMFTRDCQEIIPDPGKTVSGLKYFRNYLKDDGIFVKWVGQYQFTRVTDDVVLYLLKTINETDLFKSSPSFNEAMGIISPLFQLPLVLFIDDWISKFEIVGPMWFIYFFDRVGIYARGIIHDEDLMVYEPLEKIWRIFYERFRNNREAMGEAFQIIVEREEVHACEVMFKGLEDGEREYIIECGKNFIEKRGGITIEYEEFLLRFTNEILKNDKERELFSSIPRES